MGDGTGEGAEKRGRGRPRDPVKKVQQCVMLTPDAAQHLESVADIRGVSKSSVVERLLMADRDGSSVVAYA